ncbi:MAG TPA: hypothetical protein VEA59_03145 [Patescibacteria group bacterium]|nr:hypothetical protein [Patescibacteria group bacterium]
MNNIETILADLYALDPTLKAKDAELRDHIQALLAAKPDITIDAKFASDLRRMLMARAEQKQISNTYSFMKKLNYVFGSVGLAALVIAGVIVINQGRQTTQLSSSEQLLAGDIQISKLSSNAFGALNTSNIGTEARSQASITNMASSPTAVPELAPNVAMDASLPMSEKMIAPPTQNITYTYAGEELKLTDTQLDVYKRVKGISSTTTGQNILKQLNLGVVDGSTFSNPKLGNLTLSEDREFGYDINVDLREGYVNIYANWQKWPQPYKDCKDENCYRAQQLKPSDIPDDATIISTASKFLKDHNISTAKYGTPFVMDTWRSQYASSADKSQLYIPDEMQVVYPMSLAGKEVYDQGGNKTGLMVNVNVRYKRASGVSELTSQQYQSSAYPAETDVKKILDMAKKGGYFPLYYHSPAGSQKTVEAKLGTPTLAYFKTWQYNDGQGNELLVPALVFPVTSQDSSISRSNILVPLIKEILDNPYGGPMPMMMDSAPAANIKR